MTDSGSVAVVGAGTMGRGIAEVASLAGHKVALFDVKAAQLDTARAAMAASLAKAVEKGKRSKTEADAALARVRGTTDLPDALSEVALVVEAVPEDPGLKRRVLADIVAHAPADALIATNTSSLGITGLADALPADRRARFAGMHFFNPVPVMALVEVVRGAETSDATVEALVAESRRMGKEPIIVRDAPGFATSRLGVAIGLEAIRMLEDDVASAEDIDRAMELGYRHPMGPLRLTDLVGLDVRLGIAEHLAKELGPRFEPPKLLRDMVKEGRLGKKSGRGFYEWEGKA